MTTRDAVLARLRGEKIKLWLPPYHLRGVPADDNGALNELAGSLASKLAARDGNSNDATVAAARREEIRRVLVELQDHAVQKLIDKNSVDIKILNSRLAATHISNAGTDVEAAFSKASWGDQISILKGTTQNRGNDSNNGNSNSNNGNGDKSLRLHVTNLSPTLTVKDFSSDICRALNAKTVRVIWRGKNLLSSSADGKGGGGKKDGDVNTLCKLLAASNISGDSGSNGGNAVSNRKKKGELLCLVSGTGFVEPAASAAAASSVMGAGSASPSQPTERTDSSVIQSIREAAHTLQNSPRGMRFEVTDQNGNLVPMKQSDTVAFLTALGLHRIGRSKMEKRDDVVSNQTNSTGDVDVGDGGGRDAASALVFLLEADAEWNTSPALTDWKTKVDNYGLLQLDIAWCYLLLESLDGLDDAVRRLGVAEKSLRKQVHSNFVTLALAQAEMENAVPPLCAVFVRLFLLQGVARRMLQRQHRGPGAGTAAANDGDAGTAAEERLAWARLLCQRLRSSAPPDAVESLCGAYFVDPSTAVAALRRSNGDPDAAGNLIASDRDDARRAARKRRRQRRAGRCANGTDLVDLDLASALAGMLGFGDGAGGDLFGGANEDDDEGQLLGGDQSTGASIAIGLLRLSNNSVDGSLDLFNTIGADQVMERVARLDQASGGRKRRSPKTAKPIEREVRDVDVATLVSMGAEEARSRAALRAAGDVEGALLWLSRDDGENKCDNVGMEGGTSGNAALAEDSGPKTKIEENPSAAQTLSESSADDSASDQEETEQARDAHALLERELGNALGAGSSQLLEKEWLGVDMQDEWDLIQKYG